MKRRTRSTKPSLRQGFGGGRGIFIVLEGTTSSGKTTHAQQLCELLTAKGIKVILNDEPTKKSMWGKLIRMVVEFPNNSLTEPERQQLFVMDRAHDLENTILPNLKKGAIVLQDRYVWSTFAHGMAAGLSHDEIWSMHKKILGKLYRKPDYTIFLDVKPEISIQRLIACGKKIDMYENIKQTKKIYKIYKKLTRSNKFRKVVVIDANGTVEGVYKKLLEKFKELRILN